jgi:hypothetical protein
VPQAEAAKRRRRNQPSVNELRDYQFVASFRSPDFCPSVTQLLTARCAARLVSRLQAVALCVAEFVAEFVRILPGAVIVQNSHEFCYGPAEAGTPTIPPLDRLPIQDEDRSANSFPLQAAA